MKKTLLILTAVITIMVFCIGLTISASAEDTIHSGTWGKLSWSLNETTGELSISGTGAMRNFDYNSTLAWLNYKSSIKSVTIGDGVTSIGSYAFCNCTSLTSVTIPDSVTSIGYEAFIYCDSLTSVYISDIAKWCEIKFSGYSSNPLFYAKNLYLNGVLVTSLVIPDGVTSIGSYAFYNCRSLTSVNIPDSVTSIGNSAFEGCTSLTSVTIPDSVTSIGSRAFRNCTSLTSVNIPDSVTSIGNSAFSRCTSLTSVTIPDSVTRIGSSAFELCTSLTSITLPFVGATIDGTSNTHFGYIFGAGGNKNVVPTSLKTVIITCGTTIDDNAFEDCVSLTSITLPDSVTSIGNSAFEGCTSLTSVTIPDSVTRIGSSAFELCTSLTSVVLSKNMNIIEESVFYSCKKLKTVTIPSSIVLIKRNAFYNCTSLEKIIFCGTEEQWNAITKLADWDKKTGDWSLQKHYLTSCEKHTADKHKGTCYMCGETDYFDHVWNSGEITTPATHFATGVKTFTCTDCGETKTEIVEKTTAHTYGAWQNHNAAQHKKTCECGDVVYDSHNWNTGVITTKPTHTTEGVKTYTCLDCSETKTETVEKTTAHTYGAWQKHNAAQHKKTCECNDIVYADHVWNNGVITTPATHSATGVKTFTCTDCGETKTETVEKTTAHTYGAWQKHDDKQHKKICECNDTVYADHVWNNGEITTPATHLATGVKTFTCTDCGETKTETVEKTTAHTYGAWQKHDAKQHKKTCECNDTVYADHVWNNGVITTPATHFATGVKTFTCTDCGETKTETVDKTTAHTYGSWQKHDAAQHKKTCECNDTVYADHVWNNGVITTPATHFATGVKTFTCTDCGETKTEIVEKTTAHTYGAWQNHNAAQHKKTCECNDTVYADHVWNSGVITTPATHFATGIKTYTCLDCSETMTEAVEKLSAHTYTEWTTHNETEHKKTCECGDVVYDSHNWNTGEITTKPTETDEGVKTYTCYDCGKTKTEKIEKLDSTFGGCSSNLGTGFGVIAIVMCVAAVAVFKKKKI